MRVRWQKKQQRKCVAGRAIAVLEYTVPHSTLQLHACDACEVAWHGTVKVFMPLSYCSHAFPLSFRATQHSCRDTLNQDPCMQGFIKENDLSQYGPLVEETRIYVACRKIIDLNSKQQA
jgi:hypothetical protein